MSKSLDQRVEQMYLELYAQVRNRPARLPKNTTISTNYIDEKIERYQAALEEAIRNAPCAGCKKLVLAALTGLYIFKEMDTSGKNRSDMDDVEIERIKKDVERRYANY